MPCEYWKNDLWSYVITSMTDNWNTCWWSLSSWEQREKLTKHLESKFLQERFSLCGFLTHTHTVVVWIIQWLLIFEAKRLSGLKNHQRKQREKWSLREPQRRGQPSKNKHHQTVHCFSLPLLVHTSNHFESSCHTLRAAASLATHHQQSSGHQLLSLQSESFDVLLPRSKFQKQEANMMKVRLSLGPSVVADCHWVRVLLSLRSRRCLYVMKLGLHLIWIKTHSDVEGGKEKLASYFHSNCVCLTHSTKEQIHNSTKIQLKIKMYLRANIKNPLI